jgi:hypothetical protein
MAKKHATHRSKKNPKLQSMIDRYSFSRQQLVIFILAFAAIGYLLFRTFAAG